MYAYMILCMLSMNFKKSSICLLVQMVVGEFSFNPEAMGSTLVNDIIFN